MRRNSGPNFLYRQLLPPPPSADEPDSKRPKVESPPSKRQSKKPRETGKPNPLISATEKCKICLEPAAKHIHYGAVTCFSCRAFFRRSIQNRSAESYKCRKDGHCDITMKSRKSCQKCRYDKCLQVGMKSSWVLSEEERFHRFRKMRERKKIENLMTSPTGPAQLEDQFSPQFDHHSDESNHEPHRDSSPGSSHSYSGIDSDTERSFHQYSQSLSPNYVSPPPYSPGLQNIVRVESDLGDANHLNFFNIDFLSKSSVHDPFLNFELPMNGFSFQVAQPVSEEITMCEPVPQDLSIREQPALPAPSLDTSDTTTIDVEMPSAPKTIKEEPMVTEPACNPVLPEPKELFERSLPNGLAAEVTADEVSQIKAIARVHDMNYKSINFGEELIKEMVMSSVFKVPLSPSATMTAYRLMIQRVTKVAQGFDPFIQLPFRLQSTLLKHNADLIVSLRGAVFFEKRKGGLDQILITMGVDDLMAAKKMVMTALKTTRMNHIDYQTFNSLQKVEQSTTEERYNMLLQRVGTCVSFDADLVKLLSYILLFSVNFDDKDPEEWKEVDRIQEVMIGMMQRYIYSQYPKEMAVRLLSGVLNCITDLQELTWIKKQRQLASQATQHLPEDKVLITNANKPSHFNP